MNADTFEPHVGSIFHVRHALGHATGLRLIEINRIALTPTLEQFSLIFHGPPSDPLAQATYRFEHPTGGPWDLFIAPVTGSGAERMVYEACFSRIIPASNA